MSESEAFSKQDAHLAGPPAAIAIADTETTGPEANDEVVGIGILLIKITLPRGDLIRELDSYYGRREPSTGAQPGSTTVVSTEHAGQGFDEDRIRTLLQSANFVVGHYGAFVRRMLTSVIPESASYPWRCSARQIWWKNDFDARDEKLDSLTAKFGIDRPAVRSALDECHALSLVLFQRTGQTMRSPTFLGLLITKPPLEAPGSPQRPAMIPPATEPPLAATASARTDGLIGREKLGGPASTAAPSSSTDASPLARFWASLTSIFR